MNLEKLRKMYKENPILKEAFEDTFSKDELGLSETNTILSQDAFNKAFNNILKGSTQRFWDLKTGKDTEKKTPYTKVFNSDGNWLLDYATDQKSPHFWYQYDLVYRVLRDDFSLQDVEMQSRMKRLVETQYNLKDIHPQVQFCKR